MAEPFIGEIRLFAGNFAPNGWAFCHGQIIPIVSNDTLFQLIGTTYGGDGEQTFGLPDLRSRVPIHMGAVAGQPTYILGASGGAESVTLTTQQIPNHTHPLLATSSAGTANSPTGRVTAAPPAIDLYIEDTPSANAAAQAIGSAGGSQPHENMQPYVCIHYIIALFGLFPQFS